MLFIVVFLMIIDVTACKGRAVSGWKLDEQVAELV